MSAATAKETRRALRVVVGQVARDAMQDQASDLLAVRLILRRSFFGRLRWLLFGT